MYYNIVYSKRTPFRSVRKKSLAFFAEENYIFRNGVFVHEHMDSIFKIDKKSVHIRVPNDIGSKTLVNRYLKTVFENSTIGVEQPVSTDDTALESISYFAI